VKIKLKTNKNKCEIFYKKLVNQLNNSSTLEGYSIKEIEEAEKIHGIQFPKSYK